MKTSKIPTKIYTYGVGKLDKTAEKIIYEQSLLANKYYNKLVEIERNRRTQYRSLRASLSDEAQKYEQLNEEIEASIKEGYKQLQSLPDPEQPNKSLAKHKRADNKAANELQDKIKKLKEQQKELTKLSKKEIKRIEKEYFEPFDLKIKKEKTRLILLEIERGGDKRASELLSIFPKCLEDERIVEEIEALKIAPRTMCKIKEKLFGNIKALELPENIQQKYTIEQVAIENEKEARKKCGCFPGIYLPIETATKKAFEDTPFLPKFKSFDKTGNVGLQLNKGVMTAKLAHSMKDNWLKIEIQDKKIRRMKRGNREAIARISLGEIDGSKQLYLDIPFVMHRPLPEDSVIKWVYIVMNKIGLRTKYELQFTIESPEFLKIDSENENVIALNPGWRVLSNGDIRVATSFDGTKSTTLNLPMKMREEEKIAEKLLSYSDDHFNEAKKYFAVWNKTIELNDIIPMYQFTTPTKGQLLPDFNHKSITYSEKFKSAPQWNAHGKLASAYFAIKKLYLNDDKQINQLWQKWKQDRNLTKSDYFDSFEVICKWLTNQNITDSNQQMVMYLDFWRKKDSHLINWARNIQKRLQLNRREIYRKFVANLKKEYKTVIINKLEGDKKAKKPTPEKDIRVKQEENANAVRQFCGVSVLQNTLKEKFGKNYVEKSGIKITMEHFGCGGNGDTALPGIEIMCKKCHKLYDQDINATKHLWSSEQSGDEQTPGPARKAQLHGMTGDLKPGKTDYKSV